MESYVLDDGEVERLKRASYAAHDRVQNIMRTIAATHGGQMRSDLSEAAKLQRKSLYPVLDAAYKKRLAASRVLRDARRDARDGRP